MNLELCNVKTIATGAGARLTAELVAIDYGYNLEVSCWADLLTQWGADHVKRFLVKEAIMGAKDRLEQAKAQATQNSDTAELDKLAAFGAEMSAAVPVRVDSFYGALVDKYLAENNSERASQVQAEWDSWKAAQVDASGLAGVV